MTRQNKAEEAIPEATVCVLGMHRSGTSLVMRLISLAGTYMGPEESILPPNEHNRRGYWEHRSFVHINEAILDALGGRWDQPPEFQRAWESSPSIHLAALRRKARAIIGEDFGEARRWGWKDPRNSLTLPFWRKLLPNIRCVICLRNPLDVAASLQQSNEFSTAKCMDLWFQYTVASLHNTSGLPRIFIFYEDLLEDWWGEAQRLARFVGLPLDGGQEIQEEIRSVVETELWHHRSTLIDALDTPELTASAKSLYFTLRILATAARGRAGSFIETPEMQQSVDLIASYAQAERSRLLTLEAKNSALGTQVRDKDAALAERDATLAESSRRITDLEGRLSTTEKELRQAWRAFESVTSTLGYRSVERLRAAVRLLFPPGSWRRRPYRAIRRLTGGGAESNLRQKQAPESEEESSHGPS